LVCAACTASLATIGAGCPVCALPLAQRGPCGRCLGHPPAFDRTIAAFVYAYPLDRLVQSYKYRGLLAYADWFANAMLERCDEQPVADVVVAVPLSAGRQRERGFNQALEIARALARRSRIALAAEAIVRTRDTPAQAGLPWRERARNVRDAFACIRPLTGMRVLVVDDVMTTGASLDEVARTLKRAGALHVENRLVARTLPPVDVA
jgi:ComF family protein